jgi:hypothetical protein
MKPLASALHELWVSWTSYMVKNYGDSLPPEVVVTWKNGWKAFDELTPEQRQVRLGWAKKVSGSLPTATPKPPPDPRVKSVVQDFRTVCHEANGFIPEINWGQDLILVKKRLENYTPEQIKEEFYWYFQHELSKKLGCTLKVALSTFVFNKWLQENSYGS